jgi:VCBS repeat-containing protein
MAESPSSNQTTAEAGEGAVANPITGNVPALEIVLTEDGVPVIDLRDAAAEGGALVVIDGELMLRLADGTEWPVDVTSAEGQIVLQVADQAYIAASAIQAALTTTGDVLPLASLAQATAEAGSPAAEPVADSAEAAEPAAEGEAPVRGGAPFRAFEIGDIGHGLDPLLALGPTSLGMGSNPNGELADLGANAPGNGSRFVNLAPIANDDLATTSERQSIDIDVLANDRDPNPGDEIRIVGVQAEGLLGLVTLNADGTINYDPNGRFTHLGVGETATETFSYTVADQHGKASTATVTVRITGVNDAPEAADDHARTTEKKAVTINVLANDTDPDVNDQLQVVGVDATGLQGSLAFIGNGQFAYDPNGRFDYLGKGQTATETFRYAVSDQHGATDIATVEILIEGVNDAPVANDDLVAVSEKGEVRFNALANDFDPDLGDTIRVTNLFSLGNSVGQRWINHDGTVTYRPAGAYDYLGQGEVAYQQFGYTVADQHGATDTGVITVQIVGVNDAPVAKDDKVHTDEKSLVQINVLANDFDPDKNDVFGVVAVDTTGLEGELTYLGDGKFAYDPNGQFDHLAKGETATETFRYAIADQHGAFDIATAKVVIHGVNDAPTAVADHFVGYQDFGFYAPLSALLGNDFDIDGDPIQFAAAFNAVNGEVSVTDDGYVVFTPTPGYVGQAGFFYAIEDPHGAYDIAPVYVDIVPIQPGDISFEVLALYGAINEAEVTEHADGTLTIDMLFDVGAIAGAAMLLGGMPFFTAILSGEMQGFMQVTLNPDGSVQATGDVIGGLDLELIESPIFQPLGGTFLDALFGPSTSPLAGGMPTTLHAGGPNSALADMLLGQIDALGLFGLPVEAYGGATAASNALSFGDGTFFLEIGALLQGGAALFDDDSGAPLFIAELLGEFAAFAAIDIRDAVDVAANGFLDSSFDTSSAPLAFAAMGSADITGDIVIQDQAVAA